MVAAIKAGALDFAGGTVVQWGGNHSIETAICAQLDEDGLNAFVQTALDVADIGDDIRAELIAVAHRVAHRQA